MSLPLPSLLVGRYQLTRLLGDGGFVETYIATDTVLGRQVAIKLLRQQLAQDPQYVARFNREARIAASINHPHVIAVHDFGQDGALLLLVMEWVDETTLKELIREQATLPIPEAKRLIGQVPHGLGAIHQDVKPQNVLLDLAGAIKLTDFGVAKAAVGTGLGELTRSGEFLGTLTHMTPEQVLGPRRWVPKPTSMAWE
jgi:serine/threonine-protein kinase